MFYLDKFASLTVLLIPFAPQKKYLQLLVQSIRKEIEISDFVMFVSLYLISFNTAGSLVPGTITAQTHIPVDVFKILGKYS